MQKKEPVGGGTAAQQQQSPAAEVVECGLRTEVWHLPLRIAVCAVIGGSGAEALFQALGDNFLISAVWDTVGEPPLVRRVNKAMLEAPGLRIPPWNEGEKLSRLIVWA